MMFTTQPLYPWGRGPQWVGPRAILDAAVKGKLSGPRRELSSDSSTASPPAQPLHRVSRLADVATQRGTERGFGVAGLS
jgi:hypothetical protein